jgi:hypothetical protein
MIIYRGTKRLCADCGTRFYDLMSKPICPKCNTEFMVPAPPPQRRIAKPFSRPFEPKRIVAGSTEDMPEIDDEEPVTPSHDQDEEEARADIGAE